MSKIDAGLKDALEKTLAAGLADESLAKYRKDLENLAATISENLIYELQENLAYNLACHVADMAERAVTEMLKGNEDQMRRYLSCEKRAEDGSYIGWTGRGDGYAAGGGFGRHSVIHGKLFEQGAIALRKKVAQAHESIVRDERLLDLEDQVASLVEQVNKANADRECMWERLRDAQVPA